MSHCKSVQFKLLAAHARPMVFQVEDQVVHGDPSLRGTVKRAAVLLTRKELVDLPLTDDGDGCTA